ASRRGVPGSRGRGSSALRWSVAEVARLPWMLPRKSGDFRYTPPQTALLRMGHGACGKTWTTSNVDRGQGLAQTTIRRARGGSGSLGPALPPLLSAVFESVEHLLKLGAAGLEFGIVCVGWDEDRWGDFHADGRERPGDLEAVPAPGQLPVSP